MRWRKGRERYAAQDLSLSLYRERESKEREREWRASGSGEQGRRRLIATASGSGEQSRPNAAADGNAVAEGDAVALRGHDRHVGSDAVSNIYMTSVGELRTHARSNIKRSRTVRHRWAGASFVGCCCGGYRILVVGVPLKGVAGV